MLLSFNSIYFLFYLRFLFTHGLFRGEWFSYKCLQIFFSPFCWFLVWVHCDNGIYSESYIYSECIEIFFLAQNMVYFDIYSMCACVCMLIWVWLFETPWSIACQEFHGQRKLVSYSSWGHKVRHAWASNTYTMATVKRKKCKGGENLILHIKFCPTNLYWESITCKPILLLFEFRNSRNGWMTSLTQWTWICVDSRSRWWTEEGLACCSPWGYKESDTTEWLNWTELKC